MHARHSIQNAMQRARPRPARRGQLGQSLAEMGLLLPVLLVLVLLAADLGRLYYSYVTVTNGARTGAAYASQNATKAADTTGIRNAVYQDTTSLDATPTVTSSTGTDANGNTYTRVTVVHQYDPYFDWPGFPDTISLTRTVQMRVSP